MKIHLLGMTKDNWEEVMDLFIERGYSWACGSEHAKRKGITLPMWHTEFDNSYGIAYYDHPPNSFLEQARMSRDRQEPDVTRITVSQLYEDTDKYLPRR